MGRGNDAEEKQNTEASEVNPESLGECCHVCVSIPGSLGKHYKPEGIIFAVKGKLAAGLVFHTLRDNLMYIGLIIWDCVLLFSAENSKKVLHGVTFHSGHLVLNLHSSVTVDTSYHI